jgi:hypothetical protein
MKKAPLILVLVLQWPSLLLAQRWFGGEGGFIDESTKTAREVTSHSTGTPMWTNPRGFEKDVFTFARIRYSSGNRAQGGAFGGGRFGFGGRRGRQNAWSTDTPDSDLNLSFRLQQMTSMKVDPDGRYIKLTDPELMNYPFIYIVEPGSLALSDEEAAALRRYLMNGGFLMLDDFWGAAQWANMASELKKAFPERTFTDVPMDHPIYHCVFEINAKGQVPSVRLGEASEFDPEHRTWEDHGPDSETVHHRGLFDDKGRLMVFATHNTDNGDGWEREGESDYYFHNFSEKIAFPLGINVMFYVMTH